MEYLYGTLIKLIFASHTGTIESNEIALAEQPELFAIPLSPFMTLSFSDIGFKSGFCNPCSVDDMATCYLGVQGETRVHDNNQTTQPYLNGARFASGTKIVSHKGLVGRSTSVYHLEGTNCHLGLVVKIQLASQNSSS